MAVDKKTKVAKKGTTTEKKAAAPAAVAAEKKVAKVEKKAEKRPREEVETVQVDEEKAKSMFGAVEIKRDHKVLKPTNLQKCLSFGSRNMGFKERHLLQDLRDMCPHMREHSKIAPVSSGDTVVELCNLHHCNSTMYFEAHRDDVTYMWLAQAPKGPSIKLRLSNIHTADQIRMVGNCLKYSRPLLHFDKEFEQLPHLRVARSLLQTAFNVPRYHPKSKPFVDHILCFYFLDDHIWFRNYQIVAGEGAPSLLEVGPRFTMHPVAIFNGCCQGSVLWRNPNAVAPQEERRTRKERQRAKFEENERLKTVSKEHRDVVGELPVDPLDNIFN